MSKKSKKSKNVIDKNYFETIFKERFLEFTDTYRHTTFRFYTYGKNQNIVNKNTKIDVIIYPFKNKGIRGNLISDHKEVVEEIKFNLEFIKNFFNMKDFYFNYTYHPDRGWPGESFPIICRFVY